MRLHRDTGQRLFGAALLLGAIVSGAGAALIAGVYNVAASEGHFALTRDLLTVAMQRSVALHSRLAPDAPHPPDTFDPDRVQLGAVHYDRNCALCHGAPGRDPDPVVRAMLPAPPDLAHDMRDFSDRELHWIVRHGLKYTGMPAWTAVQRGDEVWMLVAFLRAQPQLEPRAYARLTGATGAASIRGGAASAPGNEVDASSCTACHGDAGRGPASRHVPVLHAQKPAYLETALRAYADGTRPSGIMQAALRDTDSAQLRDLARHYASLPRPDTPPAPAAPYDPEAQLGASLAQHGDAVRQVPACLGCHAREALPEYPLLDAQPAAYLSRQLQLWKQGGGRRDDGGATMADIAVRLDEAQIDAVSRWFATRPPPSPEIAP